MWRWSWRDLRKRWGLVAVTAIIVALGTGTYAGLGGTTSWRLRSLDASYAMLRDHQLRVRLPDQVTVDEGQLLARVEGLPSADRVTEADERLVVPIQVDASTPSQVVLVPGELVGADATGVDRRHLVAGRWPGPDEVLLDARFADLRGLPATGTVQVSGGIRVPYSGTGYSPEYFSVLGRGMNLSGAHGYAVLYGSLSLAQHVAGQAGQVNDLVLRLRPGTDVAQVARELRAAVADVGATVDTRADDEVRRSLYADARNDEATWTFLSLLILLGASFAAFNLVSRMVEAERHEIGVGMALGAPPRRLALRPFLAGAQIALAGAILGVGVGLFAGWAMRGVLTDALPLPVWITPFPLARYLQAALVGVALPVVATLFPVRRATRIEPVEALRSIAPTKGTAARRWSPWLRRFGRGRRIVAIMPLRNVVRAPRRTLLTALGIGAAITTLVAVLGMMDSIFATLDRADTEMTGAGGDRIEVNLSTFMPEGAPEVRAIAADPTVTDAEPVLRVSGILQPSGAKVETVLDVVDFAGDGWKPTISEGRAPAGRAGLVISEKAAADLGVGVGDRVVLRHPVRQGMSYRLVDTTVPVAAIHPNPLRFFTYVDRSQVGLFDLDGIVNRVLVRPAAGRSPTEVQRALFDQPGVASVQELGVLGDTLRQRMQSFTGILRVLEGFALALALLIAVNSARLAQEERRREQATMFAFGLPVGRVIWTMVVETALTALVGTLVGIAGGYIALRWLLHAFTTETFPELGVPAHLTPGTLATVLLLGVGVTACAPLFSIRRLHRLDVPATLRVLE